MVNEPILIVKHIPLYRSEHGQILVFVNEMALLSIHNKSLGKNARSHLGCFKSCTVRYCLTCITTIITGRNV